MKRPYWTMLCALAGCSISLVEHADSVSAGAVLTVDLHLQGGGEHTGAAMVCAGLPADWSVTGGTFTGSVTGDDTISGVVVRHTDQESWFGVDDGVSWSCWQRPGDADWSDASHGIVTLDVQVPDTASGRHTLLWTLGTSGLSGEYISARAASTVQVNASGHPLDALRIATDGPQGVVTGVGSMGFVAVDATTTSTSVDGVAWSPRIPGLPGVRDLSIGGGDVFAIADGGIWRYDGAWEALAPVNGPPVVSVHALGDSVVALSEQASAVRLVDGEWQPLPIPPGAETDGLATSGEHLAWLTWDVATRHAGVAVSSGNPVSWTVLPAPHLPPSQAVYDRVGVSDDGTVLWVRSRVDGTGAQLELFLGEPGQPWHAVASLPTTDGVLPSQPRHSASGWIVHDGVGSVVAIDAAGRVSRHGLRATSDDAEVLLSAANVMVTLDGDPAAVAHWDALPDLSGFTLAPGRVGEPYRASLPDTDAVQMGAHDLPAGLVCDGVEVSGTPLEAGEYEVTLEAHDAYGRIVTSHAQLRIDAVLADEPDAPQDDDPAEDLDVDDVDVDVARSGCSHVPVSAGWGLVLVGLLGLARRRRA